LRHAKAAIIDGKFTFKYQISVLIIKQIRKKLFGWS
jgi:hypothetical protein